MRSPVSLFEFMPYGAPELLQASRSHMTRAVEDPPPAPPSVIGGDKGAIVLPQGGERSEVLAPPSGLPKRDDVVYVDEYPVTILEVRPEYPSLAREAGIEGKVLVRVLVGRDGRVADAYVVPTHSIPMLDESALEAARRWVFKPALTNNHPVPVWIAIPMRFKLYW